MAIKNRAELLEHLNDAVRSNVVQPTALRIPIFMVGDSIKRQNC
jgi:hypothetical protein